MRAKEYLPRYAALNQHDIFSDFQEEDLTSAQIAAIEKENFYLFSKTIETFQSERLVVKLSLIHI